MKLEKPPVPNEQPKETNENKERLAKSKEDKRGKKDKKSKSGNVEDLNGRWKLQGCFGLPYIYFFTWQCFGWTHMQGREKKSHERSVERRSSDWVIFAADTLIYAHGEVECAIHWLLVIIIQSRTICVTFKAKIHGQIWYVQKFCFKNIF